MNWTWNVRSNDGAMNGLEFARCTTAGGFGQVLIHAAPGKAKIETASAWMGEAWRASVTTARSG